MTVSNFGGRILGAIFGLLKKPLHSRFHGPKHQRRLGQAHHFQRANSLVKLLACDAKLTRVHSGQISSACGLGISVG